MTKMYSIHTPYLCDGQYSVYTPRGYAGKTRAWLGRRFLWFGWWLMPEPTATLNITTTSGTGTRDGEAPEDSGFQG